MAVPADDRLNGYHFTGHVLGSATGTALASEGVRAAPGQKLWVFGVRWAADVIPLDPSATTSQPAPVQAFLVVDGSDVTVPLTQPTAQPNATTADSGPEFFAASLPAGAAEVALQLSYSGYSSQFSLTHLAREGVQPASLYRNANGWDTVDQANGEKDLPTPYNDGVQSFPAAALVVKLPSVTLSYFAPDGTNDPAPDGKAWLVPNLQDPLQYPSDQTESLEFGTNVTAADMTLTVPGQVPIHPKALPGGPDPQQYASDGSATCPCVFPYQYAFPVPANTTDATLTVKFPPELAWPAYSGASGITVRPAAATFPISMPAPSSPPPVANPATGPAPIQELNSAGQPVHYSSSSTLPYMIGGLLLLIALGSGGALIARRRRQPGGATTEPSLRHEAPKPHPTEAEPSITSTHHLIDIGGLQEPNEGRPQLLMIGTIRLTGVPDDPPLAPVAIEMLAFLSFHPGQRFTAEALATALGRGRKQDHVAPTMRRYANDIRRVLGDRHFPKARKNGYALIDVPTDVDCFDDLVRQSTATTDIAEQISLLTSALAFVRGIPFADRPEGSYGWAYTDNDFASLLTNRILNAAVRLAEIALSVGDTATATAAVRKGLLLASTDIALHQLGLQSAAESSPSRLGQAWNDLGQRFKAEDEPIPEVLTQTYRRLLNPVT